MAYLNYESRDGWVMVPFSGELTCETAQKVKEEVESMLGALDTKQPVVGCDLKEVRFLDSSGIGLLVFLNNKLCQKNGRLYLLQPSEAVRKTLDLVQLLSFFQIVDSEEELLIHLLV